MYIYCWGLRWAMNTIGNNFYRTQVFSLIRATVEPFVEFLVSGQLRYLTRCEGDHETRRICDNLIVIDSLGSRTLCSLINRCTSEEFYCFASADRSPHVFTSALFGICKDVSSHSWLVRLAPQITNETRSQIPQLRHRSWRGRGLCWIFPVFCWQPPPKRGRVVVPGPFPKNKGMSQESKSRRQINITA